jgi:uncharacterized membrane protein
MVLKRLTGFIAFGLLVMLAFSLVPRAASAHPEHNEQAEQAEQTANAQTAPSPGMAPAAMRDHMAQMEEQRPTTFSGRLYRFLGAMHPFAVHFPIALIPASWLALVIARRRGHAVDVIRAVIILAAIAALGAALLGWFNAGLALTDRNPIQTWHRWIGTGLALIVGAIGVWAWRHTVSVNSRAMTWVLGATTLLLLLQGWLGATLTHGMDHMTF